MEPSDETLAKRALDGERAAADRLLRRLQPVVHRLALQMLWRPADAEDATQEILLRVLTRLSQFEGRSRLHTWVYRIASRCLLDLKKRPVARMTFTAFAEDLHTGLDENAPDPTERSLALEEVKIGCTLAMLQCLDDGHRLAYLLGEVVGLDAAEAAAALELAPAAYRKRLQRARAQLESFTRTHCGLVDDAAACGCHRRVAPATRIGRIDPAAPVHAQAGTSFVEARALVRRAEQARRVAELYRSMTAKPTTLDLASEVLAALDADTTLPT